MKSIFAKLILLALFVASCSKVSENELWTKVEQARNHQNYDSTIQLCKKILEEYPDGQRAPAALYSLAEAYQNGSHDFKAAVSSYSLFTQQYPNDTLAPATLFLIGFIYNNDLQMYDSARVAYNRFLMMYPNHDLAPSARFELANLGKNPEELLPPAYAPDAKETKTAMRNKKHVH